jgi:hypothetical protein
MKASDWEIAKLGEWVAFKTGKRKRRVARPARAMLTKFGERFGTGGIQAERYDVK